MSTGKRVPLIVGNWKMHKGADEGARAAREITRLTTAIRGVEVGIAPSFTALYAVKRALEGSAVRLSSQNVFWAKQGAYTGEISPSMLSDIGCHYAIIGHSERRIHFQETDEWINQKAKALLEHQIRPILCVGESLEERDAGGAAKKVSSQIEAGLQDLSPEQIGKVVLAYEPIWAIGTGRTATPAQAEEIHGIIRALLLRLAKEEAQKIRILYGGSVKPENTTSLLSQENIDGALVGGASLEPEIFAKIVRFAKEQ